MQTSAERPSAFHRRRALVIAWMAICVLLLAIKLFTARAGYADDATVGVVFRAMPALNSWEVLPSIGGPTLHLGGENGSLWTDLHLIVTTHVWWIVPVVPWLILLGRRGLRLTLGQPSWLLVAVFLLQAVMMAMLAGRAAQTGRVDLDARWLGLLPLAGAVLSAVAIGRGLRPRAVPVTVFAFSLAVAAFLALAHQRGWVIPYDIWVKRL
jgi:hypothetical protein